MPNYDIGLLVLMISCVLSCYFVNFQALEMSPFFDLTGRLELCSYIVVCDLLLNFHSFFFLN